MTIDEIQSALRFDMDMQLFDGNTGETHSKESLKYGNEMNYIHYCANEEAIELLEELKVIKDFTNAIGQEKCKKCPQNKEDYCDCDLALKEIIKAGGNDENCNKE